MGRGLDLVMRGGGEVGEGQRKRREEGGGQERKTKEDREREPREHMAQVAGFYRNETSGEGKSMLEKSGAEGCLRGAWRSQSTELAWRPACYANRPQGEPFVLSLFRT